MKIESLLDDVAKGAFLIKNADRAAVNALRRTMMVDVPKMAITRTMFNQGTTDDESGSGKMESTNVLPDEVIAHRLAMIPIPTNLEEFHFQDECPNCMNMPEKERGCQSCQIIYGVKARGTAEGIVVRAGDLDPITDDDYPIAERFHSIPITKVYEGQYIEVYGYAVLGRGRDHIKWSPVSGVAFEANRVALLKNAKQAEEVFFSLDIDFSADEFTKGKLTDPLRVIELDKAMNLVRKDSGREESFNDAIVLEEIEGEYILRFDSDGSYMSPNAVMRQACIELRDRFAHIQEELNISLD
mgnify:FL=1